MNKLFKAQQMLQMIIKPESNHTMTGQLCEEILQTAFYLNQEVVELVEELGGGRDINKPWKNGYLGLYETPICITSKVRSEAIDVLKFAMNICLMAGITPENIDAEFLKVHEKNLYRIDNGY